MFRESIKMSWSNIVNNKMRSFLTILGIVIGVASIIALITIVQGATNTVTNEVASMGADKISVSAKGTVLKPGLIDSDVKNLSKIENISGVSPTLMGTLNISYDKKIKEDVSVQGKNDVYFAKTADLLATGRAINILDIKDKNRVCLVGKNIASELFYGENPIGKKLFVGGKEFLVIGTLMQSSGFTLGNNDAVIIPYTTAMNFLGTNYINSVDLYMNNGELSNSTTKAVKNAVNLAFNNNTDGYSVSNMQNILDRIKSMTGILSMMLGGIASISLVVGGIGIMNMMLVSVTERTSEIGLRKALGAQPKRIQQQFLIEAVFLSVLGGVIGLGLGSVIAYTVCILIGTGFAIAPSTVGIAIGFSVAIGIIFGIAPARKASKLNPIDALRSI